MSFNNPYQNQQHPYNNGYAMNNTNLPSLHEQSPYRTHAPPPPLPHEQPQFRTMSNLPPPPQQQQQQQHLHTEHYGQLPPPQPLPSLYESRKLYTCNEPGCSEYFDQSGGLRIHQRYVIYIYILSLFMYILNFPHIFDCRTAHGRGGDNDHSRSQQNRPYVSSVVQLS